MSFIDKVTKQYPENLQVKHFYFIGHFHSIAFDFYINRYIIMLHADKRSILNV